MWVLTLLVLLLVLLTLNDFCEQRVVVQRPTWRMRFEISYPMRPWTDTMQYHLDGYWHARRFVLGRWRVTLEHPITRQAFEDGVAQRRAYEQRLNEVQARRRFRARPVPHRWYSLR